MADPTEQRTIQYIGVHEVDLFALSFSSLAMPAIITITGDQRALFLRKQSCSGGSFQPARWRGVKMQFAETHEVRPARKSVWGKRRSSLAVAARCAIEPLEQRILLSGNPVTWTGGGTASTADPISQIFGYIKSGYNGGT